MILREAFEESDLPFRVDFFVWDEIPEIFHENIKSEYVVFQEKKKISNQVNAYRLNELIEIKHGFAFKGKYFKGEETKDILITPGNFKIGGGFKADKLKFYDGPIPEQYVLNQSDLIVTMTDLSKKADTLGYPALVPRLKKYRFLHNQRIGLVNIKNKQRLEKYFLYYLLHSEEYRHYIVETATGSTVKHTSPDRILEYKCSIPDINTQKKNSSILLSIDEKIETNKRINALLEKIAKTIFKSWFVDFDPVHAKKKALERGLSKDQAERGGHGHYLRNLQPLGLCRKLQGNGPTPHSKILKDE